jgi:hypothetical protein
MDHRDDARAALALELTDCPVAARGQDPPLEPRQEEAEKEEQEDELAEARHARKDRGHRPAQPSVLLLAVARRLYLLERVKDSRRTVTAPQRNTKSDCRPSVPAAIVHAFR